MHHGIAHVGKVFLKPTEKIVTMLNVFWLFQFNTTLF